MAPLEDESYLISNKAKMFSKQLQLSWPLHFGILFFPQPFLPACENPYQRHSTTQLIDSQREKFAIQWAETQLNQNGVLKSGPKGLIYMKVDDNYIHHLFSILEPAVYVAPPYFRRSDAIGAHIPVFYADEVKKIEQLGEMKELGSTYSFKIRKLAILSDKNHDYIVLQIESSELEALRKKYQVSPLLRGHDFQLTIAKKTLRQRQFS